MPVDKGAVTEEEDATECAICMSGDCDAKLSECHHIFHWDCLFEMIDKKTASWDKCPTCRTKISSWYDKDDGRWMDNG